MTLLTDADQRHQALDPTGSFIVRAPAGSGKTGLLIQRFLTLLARVDEPEEVIAITFTIKAADEMRSRVLEALESESGVGDDYQQHIALLAAAVRRRDSQRGWGLLMQPNRLRILTIDALCLWLVRQMVWVSRAGAELRPADEPRRLYLKAARNLFAALSTERNEWAVAVGEALAQLDNDVPRFERLLVEMLGCRDQWLRYLSPLSGEDELVRAGFEQALERACQDMIARFEDAIPDELQHTLATIDEKLAMRETGKSSPVQYRHRWQRLASVLLTQKGEPRRRFTRKDGLDDDPPLKQDLTDAAAALTSWPDACRRLVELRALPPPAYDDAQWRRLRVLADVLKRAVAELWLVFAESGEVDFIELASRAGLALGDAQGPTDLALALDYRIMHLLVDEFQDTSLSQIELLEKLLAGWQPGDGRTLFLVGDPMQSIYRFREADVGLYLQVRDHGLGGVNLQPLTLQTNFRSRPEVVDWINDQFPVMLPAVEQVSSGAVAYSPSVSSRSSSDEAGVTVHALVADDGSAEAECVTTLIRDILAANPEASVAVLVRARLHLASILPALRACKIAYRGVNLDALATMPVVQDLLALTRALAYPADRVAWLSVLRAPWCGLGLGELTVIASFTGDGCIAACFDDEAVHERLQPPERGRLRRLAKIMAHALRRRGRCSWRTLIEQTWFALGGPAVAGENALTDAGVFFGLIESIELETSSLDIERLTQAVSEKYSSAVEDEARVEIMTLHNAKGLEFDHVIVPGLERSTRTEGKRVIEWTARTGAYGQRDFVLSPMHAKHDSKEPVYQLVRRLEAEKIKHETARLLYVVSTRARESLHLIGNAKRTGDGLSKPWPDSLLAPLWPLLASEFETVAQAPESPVGVIRHDSLHAERWRVPAHWQSSITPRYAPGTEAAHTETALEFDWAGASARHIGTVVHQMLCRMADDDATAWAVGQLADWLPRWRAVLASLGVSRAALDGAAQRVQAALWAVMEDQRGRWLLYGPHAQSASELPLSGAVDGKPVNGVLDRTFIDQQGVRWIVDYKTGTHAGSDLDAFMDREQLRYQPQLERYAVLLSGLEQVETRLALYFPLHRGWREWAPGEPPPLVRT